MLTPQEKTELIDWCHQAFKEMDHNYPDFFLDATDKNPQISYIDDYEGTITCPNTEESIKNALTQMMEHYTKNQNLEIGFFIYLCGDNALISFDQVTEEDEELAKDAFTDTLTLLSGRTIFLGYD